MNKIIRNIAGLVLGIVIGSFVNMSIIKLNGTAVPLPEGIDPTNMESIKAGMHKYTLMNYLVVFLAHWMGTFTGAITAGLIASSSKLIFMYAIGALFMLGGLSMIIMLPTPIWFAFVDLAFAYIPVAWLAGKLVNKK